MINKQMMDAYGKKELRRLQNELEAAKAQADALGTNRMTVKDKAALLGIAPDPVELQPLKGKEMKCVEYLVGMESRIVESGEALRPRLALIPLLTVTAMASTETTKNSTWARERRRVFRSVRGLEPCTCRKLGRA